MDALMRLGKKRRAELKPADCIARYICIKHSQWRGKYKRLLCITPTAIHTQSPDTNNEITNSYSFVGDPDIESVTVGKPGTEDADFILSARQEKKGKFKPVRFTCTQRASLLSDLFQCLAAAAAVGQSVAAARILGSPESFAAFKLQKGEWLQVTLRLTAYGLEQVDHVSGSTEWRMDFCRMGRPGLLLLAPPSAPGPPAPALSSAPAPEAREGMLGVFSSGRQHPRVYACRQRDVLVQHMQQAANKKLGITIAVESSGAVTLTQLLSAMVAGERAASLEGGGAEVPLGQWEVQRLKERHDVLPPQLALCTPAMSARQQLTDAPPSVFASGANMSSRRVVVTSSSLLERRSDSYELADRRSLAGVASLVRFQEEPQLLGIEWLDGSAPTLYFTAARDPMLACLLDAVQSAAGRPISVLPGCTGPADPLDGRAPAHDLDVETERMFLEQLQSRGKEAYGVLQSLGAASAGGAAGAMDVPRSSLLEFRTADGLSTSPMQRLTPDSGSGSPIGGGMFVGTPPRTATIAGPGAPSAARRQLLAAGVRAAASGMVAKRPAGRAIAGGAAGSEHDPLEVAEVLMECVYEFNACVPASGVSTSSTLEETSLLGLINMLPEDVHANAPGASLGPDDAKQAVALLQCLQRLAGSPQIANSIASTPGFMQRLLGALSCGSDHIAFEAARCLTRLFAPAYARAGSGPWRLNRSDMLERERHGSSEESTVARTAKTLALQGSAGVLAGEGGPLMGAAALLAPLKQTEPAASPLTVLALVEAIAAVVVEPCSRTSDSALQAALLQQLAELGRPFFALFAHPAGRVADGAAVMMRAIAERGAAAAAPMREAALREGALLHHLHLALFASGPKTKLSRELVAYWADEYGPALALLRRIFPPGLMRFLNAPKALTKKVAAIAAGARPLPEAVPPATPPAPIPRPSSAPQDSGPSTPPATPPVTSGMVSREGSQTGAPPGATPNGAAADAAAAPGPESDVAAQVLVRDSAQTAGSAPSTHSAQPPSSPAPQQAQPLSTSVPAALPAAAAAPAAAAVPSGDDEAAAAAYSLLAGQVSGGLKGNWEAFWGAVLRDHSHAGLIWNETSRLELREALEREEGALRARRMRLGAPGAGGSAQPSWNHAEFSVEYASLSRHLSIGGVYVKLLLEGGDAGAVDKLPAPRDLFLALHQHCLAAASSELQLERWAALAGGSKAAAEHMEEQATAQQLLCVRAMAALYHAHAGSIGSFDGVGHVVRVLDLTLSRPLRQALAVLIEALMLPTCARGGHPAAQKAAQLNASAFVDAGGVEVAVDMVAAAHHQRERRHAGGTAASAAAAATLPAGMLLTSVSHADMPREWWFYPLGHFPEGRPASVDGKWGEWPLDELGRCGPVTKEELVHLLGHGQLSMLTECWASTMIHPMPIWRLRELRWLMSKGVGAMSGFQMAALALRLLQQLVELQPARDEAGQPLQPPPRVLRLLSSQRCLPHLAQVMLTGEPELIERSASLLEAVAGGIEEAAQRLYLTGAFYFALAYAGSNLSQLARLFKATHLRQSFRGIQDASTAGLPLSQRSYLGHLLPESLLHMLESYGPTVFAEALAGDHDTPELIWTASMRGRRLIPALLQHLGDFPLRLAQHSGLAWDYAPLPPLSYPELEEEIWCWRYYLRNLADTGRFADWNIVDHVPFLQAMLAEWRAELGRQPLSMSEVEACEVLGITPGPNGAVAEDDMRKAYRSMARKYHPDKNPEGRPMFLRIQKAYDRLQAGAAGGQGPQPWRLQLILRAQCILFRRCADVLRPFKFAGYMQLLEVVRAQAEAGGANGHFLSGERVPLVQAATELCWLTCVCSQLNSQELMRCGGIPVLSSLLNRCVSLMPKDSGPSSPTAAVTTSLLRTFAGLAAVEAARKEMVGEPSLLADVVRCCALDGAPAAVDAALIAIAHMAASAKLQVLLLECGVMGYVVPLLLGYDSTLKDEVLASFALPFGDDAAAAVAAGGALRLLDSPLLRGNASQSRSYHALLAAQALARLAGQLAAPHATPDCPGSLAVLRALLTPSLSARLAERDPRPLVLQMNSSLETPQVIWNNGMREELLALMSAQQEHTDLQALTSFQYRSLKGELQVAGVFVRLFNARPASLAADASLFCKGLVRFLFELLVEPGQMAIAQLPQAKLQDVLAVLRALQLLLDSEPRTLGLLASKSALSPFMACVAPAANRQPAAATVQSTTAAAQGVSTDGEDTEAAAAAAAAAAASALDAGVAAEEACAAEALVLMLKLTANAACIAVLAEEAALRPLFWLLHNPPSFRCLQGSLQLLHVLASQPMAAWVAASQAGAIYLLGLLLHTGPWPWRGGEAPSKAAEAQVQGEAAGLLGRLMGHPVHGPRVMLVLLRLLPPGLVDTLKDGAPEAALRALRETAETPECMWDQRMASAAAAEVATLAAQARQQQAQGGTMEWQLPATFIMEYEKLRGELYVGGVYVRLFLKDPNFPIRDPQRFAQGLMERYMSELGPSGSGSDAAVLVAAAAVALLQLHPALAEHVAQLGLLPKLLGHLAARKPPPPPPLEDGGAGGSGPTALPDDVGGSVLRLLHQLAASNTAAEVLSSCPPPALVPTLVAAMRWGPAATLLVLETLKRVLSNSNRNRDLLVSQALSCGLVPLLLGILDWKSGDGGAQHSEAAVQRALAVDVLHLLMAEGLHAQQVRVVLDGSEVWQGYRHQRHDLFLPSGSNEAGGVAGLLTAGDTARFALPAPDSMARPRLTQQ